SGKVGAGFPKRSCSNKRIERDDDSKKGHHGLGANYTANKATAEAAKFAAIMGLDAMRTSFQTARNCEPPMCNCASGNLEIFGFSPVGLLRNDDFHPLMNASRSALIVAASVVGMPCGKLL